MLSAGFRHRKGTLTYIGIEFRKEMEQYPSYYLSAYFSP